MRNFILFKRVFLLVFVLTITFIQCSKDETISDYSQVTIEETISTDPVVKNFLTRSYLSSVNENINGSESRNYDETIDKVIAYLDKQNSKRSFISKLTKKYGYPIWDRSYVYTTRFDNILFTPLAPKDGKEITSFFVAFPFKDSYHVELYTKKNINGLIKSGRENNALIFSVLYAINADLEIFNYSNKEYKEWYSKVSSNLTNEDIAETRECVAYTVCVPIVALQGEKDRAETRSDIYCYTAYVCENDDVNSGGSCTNCGDGGGSGSPSGGGSSGSPAQTLEDMFFDQFKYKTINFANSTDAQRITHILRIMKIACQVPGIQKINLGNFFTNINIYGYTAHANISGRIVAVDWATNHPEINTAPVKSYGGYVPSINGLNDPNGGTVRFTFNRFYYGGGNYPAIQFVVNSNQESGFKQQYLPCY